MTRLNPIARSLLPELDRALFHVPTRGEVAREWALGLLYILSAPALGLALGFILATCLGA